MSKQEIVAAVEFRGQAQHAALITFIRRKRHLMPVDLWIRRLLPLLLGLRLLGLAGAGWNACAAVLEGIARGPRRALRRGLVLDGRQIGRVRGLVGIRRCRREPSGACSIEREAAPLDMEGVVRNRKVGL